MISPLINFMVKLCRLYRTITMISKWWLLKKIYCFYCFYCLYWFFFLKKKYFRNSRYRESRIRVNTFTKYITSYLKYFLFWRSKIWSSLRKLENNEESRRSRIQLALECKKNKQLEVYKPKFYVYDWICGGRQ